MSHWKIALRSLKNLCAFVGAIALFSYFYNWTLDVRHWYVTLASAFMCSILWLGFYVIEVRKEAVTHFSLALTRTVLGWLSQLRTKPAKLPIPQAAIKPEEKLT